MKGEDVADLDAALEDDGAVSVRARISLLDVADVSDGVLRNIPVPVDAGEVLAVMVRAAVEVSHVGGGAVDDDLAGEFDGAD